jgi:hypothetical protein
MAAVSFTIPRTTVDPGARSFDQVVTGHNIRTVSLQADITQWTLPGTLDLELFASFDGGATFVLQTGASRKGPPGPDDDGPTTAMGFSETFDRDKTPTNLRVTVAVTQNAIPLGPTTFTIST